jgi:peptidyl-prolyl cis-trans isomerase C
MKKILHFLKKHKKNLLMVSGAFFLVIVFLVILMISRKGRGNVIAVVNGRPITVTDILVETELSPEFYKETLITDPDSVLEEYINQILLFGEAKKYERELGKKVQSRMRNHYIKELTSAYVETKLVEDIKISEEVIAEHYNSHLEDFVIPERVRLLEIVVSTQRAAEDVLRRLSMGESFETLVARESIAKTRENGGDIGWIDVRKLEPEVTALVTRINSGDILANPIRSEAGYHIIKLAGRTQKRMLTLQEATPIIENILLFQEKKRVVDSLVKELREESKIQIFLEKIDLLKQKQ